MKYYGKGSLSSLLKLTLDILLLLGVLLFFFITQRTLFAKQEEVTVVLAFVYFLFLVGGTSLIFIVYNLRKIVQTLLKPDPFTYGNVKSLKNIWIGCFLIAACYFINFFINFNKETFEIIYISTKGIHTDFEFFIFLFAGLFILVLEKVFKVAVEYKEDHDLTI